MINQNYVYNFFGFGFYYIAILEILKLGVGQIDLEAWIKNY